MEEGIDALANAVKSQVNNFTQYQGWRLLDSTLNYASESLTFDGCFFLDSNEDAIRAWSLVPLLGGATITSKAIFTAVEDALEQAGLY